MLFAEVIADKIFGQFRYPRTVHAFSDRDKLHFPRYDSLARIPQLGDGMTGGCPERPARRVLRRLQRRKPSAASPGELGVAEAQIAVVLGAHVPALVFRGVSPLENPCPAQGRQPLFDVSAERRIAPWPAGVVDSHRLVNLRAAV